MLSLLISSYGFVATAGHLEILGSILNTGANSHDITTAAKSRPLDSRPYLTERRYIAPSFKIQIPSDALVSLNHYPDTQSFSVLRVQPRNLSPTESRCLPYRPRDPPLA